MLIISVVVSSPGLITLKVVKIQKLEKKKNTRPPNLQTLKYTLGKEIVLFIVYRLCLINIQN